MVVKMFHQIKSDTLLAKSLKKVKVKKRIKKSDKDLFISRNGNLFTCFLTNHKDRRCECNFIEILQNRRKDT